MSVSYVGASTLRRLGRVILMSTLRQLASQAAALAGDDTCALGHDWETDGGRACPYDYTDEIHGDCTGQAVYVCARCGDTDYGDPGGPAFNECDFCAKAEKERTIESA